MSTFGRFIKARREELQLDQASLARQLGVHQQTVSKWEQAMTLPQPQRIRRLAEVLRVDVSDLMRHAGYLPGTKPEDVEANAPLDRLLAEVRELSNDELIVLIERAWAEYRARAGPSERPPRRPPAKRPSV